MIDEAAARRFIYAHGRVLERRVYAALFEGAAAAPVADCLRAYQNEDGGFGHGLEPDKRVPHSQALDVEIAFERLAMIGLADRSLIDPACDWLMTVADDRGAVPILAPSNADYPRAGHWFQSEYAPDWNPTAGICAHVHSLGLTHPWVELATEGCLHALESDSVPDEAHALLGVTKLLGAIPDRERADRLAPTVSAALATASFYSYEANADSYGVTPLQFAPRATSFARGWFPDEVITAHRELLSSQQQTDGGWPIAWEPVSEATRSEWRTIKTINALRALRDSNPEPPAS